MNLRLERKWLTKESTEGELAIDGARECFTLEDVVRPAGVKIPGETAIPPGRYQVILTLSERAKLGTLWSPRADHMLPLLLNVPGFDGIRIHAGNRASDTEGCIIVGHERAENLVSGSRVALVALMAKLEVGLAEGPVHITVVDAPAGVLA
ncbi:MAG: hypothetical protein DMD91_30365 [Candidatus Rokuibacteriota bacterium]|nr:MAG: hypothetical protein DMD91_30365 [Candidatus Rokubacteria bacterium]